jgi:crossover junction endodeoxyribonuclease RuvC
MIFCGVDPGLNGAIAFFEPHSGRLDVVDMPTVEVLRGGKAKREVSPQMLAGIMRSHIEDRTAVVALERVNAMRGQGVTSVFSFGRSSGVVEGVVAALSLAITLVPPQTWQKALNVRNGKDGSRARAAELFPAMSASFARVKDDGRSDASLIAYWLATSRA